MYMTARIRKDQQIVARLIKMLPSEKRKKYSDYGQKE
jgi:hypothetical protein